ncbi:histidine phosphatase family protein [Streptomyces sp. HNM0575]|uniref:histidine phosphatase family protein n=1 Tax=Streptomyces sp. HNM0575 TaxID=2716338 RepID=UPI00145D2CD9|nr:histidine phosphatase family protein [Streptomyces sp. HNM0575]NLU74458.1 histidine phosphatase family protein [Streptomyces sp. HNM0575]
MTTRVTLISPARSESSEAFRFDDGRSLSAAGLRDARRARAAGEALLRAAGAKVLSPSPRCVRTAEELGLSGAASLTDVRLSGCATGRWRGRTLEEVGAADPEGVARWLSDPESAPHGGESVAALCARAGEWLADLADREHGRVVAVVEPDVVRAAVVCALGAPAGGLWRVDVAPLTATELSGRAGRWNLRAGRALADCGDGHGHGEAGGDHHGEEEGGARQASS